ncbi:MAG: hypothetical protein FWC47_15885, partial [Oscillospiraceae bacterium]|nr:hypothetical protein [Oscillospiraceae bacterium]
GYTNSSPNYSPPVPEITSDKNRQASPSNENWRESSGYTNSSPNYTQTPNPPKVDPYVEYAKTRIAEQEALKQKCANNPIVPKLASDYSSIYLDPSDRLAAIQFLEDEINLHGGQIGLLSLKDDNIMDEAVKGAIVKLANIDRPASDANLQYFIESIKSLDESVPYINNDYYFTLGTLDKAIGRSDKLQDAVNAGGNAKFNQENLGYTYSNAKTLENMMQDMGGYRAGIDMPTSLGYDGETYPEYYDNINTGKSETKVEGETSTIEENITLNEAEKVLEPSTAAKIGTESTTTKTGIESTKNAVTEITTAETTTEGTTVKTATESTTTKTIAESTTTNTDNKNNNTDDNKFPPRTPEAEKEAQKVVDVGSAIKAWTAPDDIALTKNSVTSVFVHEDGSVSVGISGTWKGNKFSNEYAKQLEAALNESSMNEWNVSEHEGKNKYTVSSITDVELKNQIELPKQENGKKILPGANGEGNCAEPKMATAAHYNDSEITGYDIRNYNPLKADSELQYPGGDANQMIPCPTCDHNEEVYMEYANGNNE